MRLRQTTATPRPIIGDYGTDYSYRAGVAAVGLGAAGPSSLWLDATGQRLPVPLFRGFDTLGTLAHIMRTGHEHTWFTLTQKIIEKEFALSGSEQNPNVTGKRVRHLLQTRIASGAPGPVEAFKRNGADFVVARDLRALVEGMKRLTDEPHLDVAQVEREVVARGREMDNPYTKDLQVTAIHGARRYAAGEVAGFGGGSMHGYRALEGTFLGGCLFSGRTAGRAEAEAVR